MILQGVPEWFPQGQAPVFFTIKFVLALASVILVLITMIVTWSDISGSRGRRFRDYALLGAALTLSGRSYDQVLYQTSVSWRIIGGFLEIILIIAAAVISLRESVVRKRKSMRNRADILEILNMRRPDVARDPKPDDLPGRHLQHDGEAPSQDP